MTATAIYRYHRFVDRFTSDSLAFRRTVRRAYALGPRPIGELLLEVAREVPAAEPAIADALLRYAELDPHLVGAAGARDWLDFRPRVVS